MDERDIFFEACEITEPQARERFLEIACAGNDALKARISKDVEAKLRSVKSLDSGDSRPQTAVDQSPDSGSTVIIDATMSGDDASSQTPADQPPNAESNHFEIDEDRSFSFLQPSANPNSLGYLGSYEFIQILGRGSFGIVFKAFDQKLCRMVAIKILAPELAVTSPARKRFLREAQASAAVCHENIVHIYGIDEQPIPHIVMEYVPGQTIQQRIDLEGPLEVMDVVRLGKQIANGLAAAHSIGLIHRDIKPGNILLENNNGDQVKLTDFGLARAADDASISQSGLVAGTPMFMSPEQAQGHDVDARSDLFSLGSVLYVMVSGRPPFRASTSLAVLKRVTEDVPRPIQDILPTVPNWLCDIISKLHAKRPEERFQSASEVGALLCRCQSDLERGVVPKIDWLETPQRSLSGLIRRRLRIFACAGLSLIIVAFALTRYFKNATIPQLVNPPAKADATVPSVAVDAPIALGPLLEPSRMGDGSFDNVSFNDNVLTMNGTGSSPNLWIDFLELEKSDLTIQGQIRVLNPEAYGFAKFVFKAYSDTEVFALFCSDSTVSPRVWIDFSDRARRDEDGIPVPRIAEKDWVNFKFTVSRDMYSLYIGDKLELQAARERRALGYVAIGGAGWQTEVRDLNVILHDHKGQLD